MGIAAVVFATPTVLRLSAAEAATNPCGGYQMGTRPIWGDGAPGVVGELVVYRTGTNTWCGLTYHRGAAVGVAMPTTIEVTSPSGTRTLASGNYTSFAGPGRVTTSTCAAGTAPCFSFTGSLTYNGVRLRSLPFYLVDNATDADPCGGTLIRSAPIKAGTVVIGEVAVYRLSASMVCGITYHRGPTYGVALYTELGHWEPDGKGLVDSGTFSYYAGPGQVWDVPPCPADSPRCRGFDGGIKYQGTTYFAGVSY